MKARDLLTRILLIACALLPSPSFSSDEPPGLAEHREKILLASVRFNLKWKLPAIQECVRKTRDLKLHRLEAAVVWMGWDLPDEKIEQILHRSEECPPGEALKFPELKNFVRTIVPALEEGNTIHSLSLVDALGIYQEATRILQERCPQELSEAERKQDLYETRKFKRVTDFAYYSAKAISDKYGQTVKNILDDIHPRCLEPNTNSYRPNGQGPIDTNPCFAAERPVLRMLNMNAKLKNTQTSAMLRGFVYELFDTIEERARSGSREPVDLHAVFRKSVGQDPPPKLFLAMLAYFYSSTKSPSGVVDNYGDQIWKDALKSGLPPDEALSEYNAQKRILDQFRGVANHARTNQIAFSAGDIDLKGFNHHDMSAAFLTCELIRIKPRALVDKVPVILGYAYESLDFASHISDGVGVQESIDNFNRDTNRYARGRELGKKFCD